MIDAHHHIWRQKDLPWLLGPEQPRIFGQYGSIKRDYLIAEYLQDVTASGIKKSVYVQANWHPNWAHDEALWVQSVADETGWPHAIVAYADFTTGDVTQQLKKLSEVKLVRGIRQQLHWHFNPLYQFASRIDIGSDRVFQMNVAKLADYDWCFDLQVFSDQASHAVALAKACPDVNFVLQHAGMLEDTSERGWGKWREAMKLMSACANIHVKLSGLGTFVRKLDAELIQDIVSETTSVFGAERCLYGSNFPIEKIWTSYDQLFNTLKAVTADFDEHDVKAIFNDNAERLYGL